MDHHKGTIFYRSPCKGIAFCKGKATGVSVPVRCFDDPVDMFLGAGTSLMSLRLFTFHSSFIQTL